MMHRPWSSIVEVPYCFSRSNVKFQGHTALKIIKFYRNWAFLDSNSSLNSLMVMKCCTKLETAKERCPVVFQSHPSNFKVTQDKTSPLLTRIGRFRTIGRSQLSNPWDLPCYVNVYCCHSSTSSLSFNFWLIYENFYFRLKKNTLFSTHFMILHNFCFLFLNWQQVVNVSHDSQYVAKRKLKCHWIRLHRIIKQIYIDKDNLHGQWAAGALSQVFSNLRTLLSGTEQ